MTRHFTEAQELDRTLQEERTTSQQLQDRVQELEQALDEVNNRVEQQQQTISLIVSEKTSLTASLERLQDADTRMYHVFSRTFAS